MKKNVYLLCAVIVCLSMCTCKSRETSSGQVIKLETAMAEPLKEWKASDYFSSVAYIPLETSDSVLISSLPSLIVDKGKVYVLNSKGRCMVFDQKTGKFLQMIGNRDKGPRGYSDCKGAWIDPHRGEINFTGWNRDFIRYALNGEFRGTQKCPADIEQGSTYTYLDADRWVVYPSSFLGRLPFRLAYLTSEGKPEKTFPLLYQRDTLALNAIQGISIFAETEKQVGNTSGRMMVIKGQMPDWEATFMIEQPVFWHWQGTTWFKESSCDTLYRLTPDGMVADRVLDPGRFRLPVEDEFKASARQEHTTIDQVTENDRFLMFSYWFKSEDKCIPYRGIVEKETGQVRVCEYQAGFRNDLDGFMDLYPSLLMWEGKYCAYLVTPLAIQTWFEENPEQAAKLKPEIQALKNLKEDDNPVLVVMTLK